MQMGGGATACMQTSYVDGPLFMIMLFFRCVTGTPIEKSLDDLYGLLLFLQCDPYSVRHWFRRCLYEPYLRGRKVIAQSIK